MPRTPFLLQNLATDAVADTLSSSGGVRRGWFLAGLVLPAGIGAATFVFWRESLNATALFPAAAIFAGALMGTASMLFTRVKDLAAKPRPEVGRDPVFQASVVFRSALYCAEVSLLLNAVLVVAAIIPPGTGAQVVMSVAIGLYVHMGMKVAMLLQGLRAQMSDVAGSRTQPPIRPTRRRSAS